MQSAANSTTSWKSLGDILPFHPTTSELDDQSIFFCRPLALLLGRRFSWMGRHAALPASATVGEGIGRKLLLLPR
jgi:hypothetical protein